MNEITNNIFKLQWEIQKKLMKDRTIIVLFKRAYWGSFIFLLFCGFLIGKLGLNDNVGSGIILIIFITNLILGFIARIKQIFTSIAEFLKQAFMVTIILGTFICLMFYHYVKESYILYLLITGIFTLIWSFLSTLSNVKIGKISNAIFAVIVGVILQANSFIWEVLALAKIDFNFNITSYGLDCNSYEFIELLIKLMLFPFFVMTTIGALACAYKEYWKEKYNKGKDIEIDLI